MKTWLAALVATAAVALPATPAQASSTKLKTEVMSQNLYIGADLSRLLIGESPAEILATVQETNFPERAVEIAQAVEKGEPDLVGLQEVSLISVFDSAGNVLLELDYLDILLNALSDQGERYAVASSVSNADVTLPVDPAAGTFARVVDRDVIIYRTSTTSVSNPVSVNFATNFTAELRGFPIEFTRGFTAVDAHIKGSDIRFVNTHLEVEGAPCLTPDGLVICQDLQAAELRDALAGETLATILVGDINAEPGMNAYETITNAGYLDTWTIGKQARNQPGYTCCQAETLLNPKSQLSQRIDHVFLSDHGVKKVRGKSTVFGDSEAEKTPSGRWYSDHGGVLARLNIHLTTN